MVFRGAQAARGLHSRSLVSRSLRSSGGSLTVYRYGTGRAQRWTRPQGGRRLRAAWALL